MRSLPSLRATATSSTASPFPPALCAMLVSLHSPPRISLNVGWNGINAGSLTTAGTIQCLTFKHWINCIILKDRVCGAHGHFLFSILLWSVCVNLAFLVIWWGLLFFYILLCCFWLFTIYDSEAVLPLDAESGGDRHFIFCFPRQCLAHKSPLPRSRWGGRCW